MASASSHSFGRVGDGVGFGFRFCSVLDGLGRGLGAVDDCVQFFAANMDTDMDMDVETDSQGNQRAGIDNLLPCFHFLTTGACAREESVGVGSLASRIPQTSSTPPFSFSDMDPVLAGLMVTWGTALSTDLQWTLLEIRSRHRDWLPVWDKAMFEDKVVQEHMAQLFVVQDGGLSAKRHRVGAAGHGFVTASPLTSLPYRRVVWFPSSGEARIRVGLRWGMV
jgi:hypothetical protein